jgi:hypothetical protein
MHIFVLTVRLKLLKRFNILKLNAKDIGQVTEAKIFIESQNFV